MANTCDEPFLSYRVAGVGLHLSGAVGDSLAHFARWFAASFYALPDSAAPAEITLQLTTRVPSAPPATPRVHPSPGVHIRRQGTHCWLFLPEAVCALDLQARHGTLWLGPGFWHRSRKRQQEPVLLALVWLLRECRRYSLHASAVARGEHGLVLAGESGSGKSTAALGLVHQGWRYLADDVVLLEPATDGLRLWGLVRGFAYHPALLTRLPELANPTSAAAELNGEKRFIELDAVYPDRHLPGGRCGALIFPHVVAQARSQLLPLEPVASLSALLQASAGLLTDKNHAATQLEFLKNLVMQHPAYRLLAGRDIFGNGLALEALLTAGGVLEQLP
jgi:hypothetical protein